MNVQEMRAVARGFAYALLEAAPFLDQLTTTDGSPMRYTINSMHRNQIAEFWHCLNRKRYVEGPYVDERIVNNSDIDNAKANTQAWLKWYQRDGHKQNDETPDDERIPLPEWGKEYI